MLKLEVEDGPFGQVSLQHEAKKKCVVFSRRGGATGAFCFKTIFNDCDMTVPNFKKL